MPVPQSFKAAVVHQPKVQNVVPERSLGHLESGEVGIKITATAVNPVDWKMRDYDAFISEYPAILGSDAAGVIASIELDVSGFAVGDRVFFQGIIGKYGSSTFQQFCKMPAVLVSKTPSNISDEQAACISLTTMAAVTAFYGNDGYGLAPPRDKEGEKAGKGKAIVVIGGASSVGQYAIQLARLSGFERIITNASPTNQEFFKGFGAHIVPDRTRPSPEDFKAVIGEFPLELVFDAISAKATKALAVQIVQAAKTATNQVVTLHAVHSEVIDPDTAALSRSKEPDVGMKQVLSIGSTPALRHLSEPMAKNLRGENGYIAKGLLTPNRLHVVSGGLVAVEEALALNKKGVSGVKVIFRPFDV